jgi:type VI secretion system protein ImpG
LLGMVLDRFFQRSVSINAFSETVIKSLQRGDIARWPARLGHRPLL